MPSPCSEEVAVLVDDTTAIREPSLRELQEWDEGRKQDVAQQIERWHEREKARVALETTKRKGKGRMSEEAIQKRKEREARRFRDASTRTAVEGEETFSTPAALDLQSELQTQARPIYVVHIPSTSTSHPWYQPSSYEDLVSAERAGLWTYPQTPEERVSCRVFRDLWEKGHYLGSGIKFGGEFLVYPGQRFGYFRPLLPLNG